MVDYDAAVAAVQDPNADPILLAKIAYENPEFGANVAVNPRCYPGLKRWIAEFGDDRARETLAQYGFTAEAFGGPVQDQKATAQAAQQPAAEQAQQPAAQAAFEEPVATNPYGFTAEQALTTTDQMQIAQIAQYAPELRACIARNPNTYPALIEWLGQLGDPAINAALASRLRKDGTVWTTDKDGIIMAKLPYPPAPELGWYSDDPVEGTPDSAVGTAEPQNDYGQPSTAEAATNTAFTAEPAATAAAAEPAATAPADTTPHAAENDIEDWDSTVLSSSFTSKAPKKTYLLHNDVTGQTIVIDKSTLLGRKPSMDVPQGAKAVRIVDPTRTTSRNHAAISIDTDGALWIEDYGSLNGTYIITNGQETQVTKGTPLKLSAPATVRIGDQFFQFTEKQA